MLGLRVEGGSRDGLHYPFAGYIVGVDNTREPHISWGWVFIRRVFGPSRPVHVPPEQEFRK